MSKRYNAECEYNDRQRELDALERQLVGFGTTYSIQQNIDGPSEPYVYVEYEDRGVVLNVKGVASKVLSILTGAREV